MAVNPQLLRPIDLASYGPVIPVIVLERVEDALPLARALYAGGVQVLEVTLRTPAALPAIAQIARELPEVIVGAGTVLNAADAGRAREAGARFVVSPGYHRELAQACRALGLPLLPGVATASEVMAALADGFTFLKLFPADAIGGLGLLKAWRSPFQHVYFCPTGGITSATAPQYLALPNVRCVGGSWLAPAPSIQAGDWVRITQLAREAQALRPA
ncbi:bifunctional 4-hydroxy-2-oxoglutarate aldolase/2-dehydro-3-deoxy-phosphogluconate aldolase [Extensimonas vulgaris]|uniref:2-dehydro-3-deoxy-phosphogluconate aldolase n=1 Tax=Extensimonas vulgaris TaxID=1031594 RepID=A0A369AM57_9BURK|nr:bifunctional 4-hydroxy-2-oxoglutarate aldolase/2-dehydro-3-deoxy-phosphogluconate aldolase [Extensimonas vulgaris]RCX10251.1 2-dehydro-3-deoxyphosphogluconate aldolase/(4S)-4-hydroxy-2-oxoglutarate aldolase [Extensimonas vulgaris]TWI39828.1 2-dehydro-3-deoxyphosphogluconate aldolase/(4S)-4-hydroxy-2-oxoglutarate aldolase [Extensimonas vulgaris]TXD17393.1 bifunctional 4-hydroxy-2-oxoglutarate aldolase/2-dehydro-3-deoxy-phosphogluconate aldolase [Extensimonas vulgaris]